jgi:phosphoglucosamine mutase
VARTYFGTDGVRGVANADLSAELALALGRAATRVALERGASRPVVVVGRDTRRSGAMLEDALCAGIASAGGVALRAGVVPTPAVAWLVGAESAALGVVISASHNPYPDNGIKLFGADGFKLSDDEEHRVEALIEEPFDPPTGAAVGESAALADGGGRYARWVAGAVSADVSGLRVAVDCANGAATGVAPIFLDAVGVRYDLLAAAPDGVNINVDCGSTHLDHVARAVRAGGHDLGLAFDGDADRLLCVDGSGAAVDGDHLLAILARDAIGRGTLTGGLVVLTSMANLGAHRALDALGVRRIVTEVGDRYVLEAMRREGAVLGGEQSGHLIALDHGTTGDGMLTAALLLDALARSSQSLAEAAALVRKYPQRLVSVRADRSRLAGADRVWAAVRAVEQALGDEGRVVLRASGTEPLVRVMVEAADEGDCDRHARDLVAVVTEELPVAEVD